MRLLYHYIVSGIYPKYCKLVVNSLKQHVAINLTSGQVTTRSQASLTDVVYKFITTSRPVEKWLQSVEETASEMKRAKVPVELLMVIGGNGAGKSHIKECLSARFHRFPYLLSLELKVASLLATDLKVSSTVDDVASIILLQTDPYMYKLYNVLSNNTDSSAEGIRKKLEEDSIDSEFVDTFLDYGEFRHDHNGVYEPLEELLLSKGNQIYLSIMKLYKKYLGVNGIYIFIDEFEDLHLLASERQDRFIESIRALYDTLASTLSDMNLPSFKIIILCTLSFWNEIHEDKRFRALETRAHPFEITPLLEDEIIAMAEKLYVLYKRSGYLKYNINIDFIKIPTYLVKVASFENEPLTPRYVIKQLINIIENPDEYARLLQQQQIESQQQIDNQQQIGK